MVERIADKMIELEVDILTTPSSMNVFVLK